jgi:hypothetical protein
MYVIVTSLFSIIARPPGFQKTASAPVAHTLYASPIAVARALGMTFRNCIDVLPTFWQTAMHDNSATTRPSKRTFRIFFIAQHPLVQ